MKHACTCLWVAESVCLGMWVAAVVAAMGKYTHLLLSCCRPHKQQQVIEALSGLLAAHIGLLLLAADSQGAVRPASQGV